MKFYIFIFVFYMAHANFNILHISFHRGCISNFETVVSSLGLPIKLTNFFIHDYPKEYVDGCNCGNDIYNITSERAFRIWSKHKDYFESFDCIVTSDTVPLSRIFIENNWYKPLIIWVCNRFDYYDGASSRGLFPDEKYYSLIKKALGMDNVKFIPYNSFESVYAKSKGVDIGINDLIQPICSNYGTPSIPNAIRSNSVFVPEYHNNIKFINLPKILGSMGIKNYIGRYNGPLDLVGFKAIVNIPGAWSNYHFFESASCGLAYFIPSIEFLRGLMLENSKYFIPNSYFFKDYYMYSEWYSGDKGPCIIYFDSWSDLVYKLSIFDSDKQGKEVIDWAQKHNQKVLNSWRGVFTKIMNI